MPLYQIPAAIAYLVPLYAILLVWLWLLRRRCDVRSLLRAAAFAKWPCIVVLGLVVCWHHAAYYLTGSYGSGFEMRVLAFVLTPAGVLLAYVVWLKGLQSALTALLCPHRALRGQAMASVEVALRVHNMLSRRFFMHRLFLGPRGRQASAVSDHSCPRAPGPGDSGATRG